MTHPHAFVVAWAPAQQAPHAILGGPHAVRAHTVLYALHDQGSETVGYASAVTERGGAALVEPCQGLSESFFGQTELVTAGLSALATMAAALVDETPIERIYRAPGHEGAGHCDPGFDDLFTTLAGDAFEAAPRSFRTIAKIDNGDDALTKLRAPVLQSLDAWSGVTMARLACEFLEKQTLWHVDAGSTERPVRAVPILFRTQFDHDNVARRQLYTNARRSRYYVRADLRSTRFISR